MNIHGEENTNVEKKMLTKKQKDDCKWCDSKIAGLVLKDILIM